MLTAENRKCLMGGKGRAGEAREILEQIGPRINNRKKGVWHEYIGPVLPVI